MENWQQFAQKGDAAAATATTTTTTIHSCQYTGDCLEPHCSKNANTSIIIVLKSWVVRVLFLGPVRTVFEVLWSADVDFSRGGHWPVCNAFVEREKPISVNQSVQALQPA